MVIAIFRRTLFLLKSFPALTSVVPDGGFSNHCLSDLNLVVNLIGKPE